MGIFHLISVLIVLSAVFAYINFRFLKLPPAIGLMLISLLFSISVYIAGQFNESFTETVRLRLENIDFSELLLEGMLSFMLFAGAIHIKYEDLKNEKASIVLFSTLSVVISTVVIGFATYFLLGLFGMQVELVYAFVFGALISPTDPIAVLSILKRAGVSKSLETKIAGESLFNDGVAVVVFITILQLAKSGGELEIGETLMLFAKEALGGLLLGVVLGFAGYRAIASIDNYQVEVLITLAVVMGGYTLAHFIHVSGPLAMVAAGLITGNHGKKYGMSDITAEYIDKFWELLDEILNAVLFVLIGLELLIVDVNSTLILVSLIMIVVVLAARYISIRIPSFLIKQEDMRKTVLVLTWGGLRGGISIALALSIQPQYHKDIWVTITYVIVCFSILVQGLTVGKLATKKVQP